VSKTKAKGWEYHFYHVFNKPDACIAGSILAYYHYVPFRKQGNRYHPGLVRAL
jgi:hypothetical protein